MDAIDELIRILEREAALVERALFRVKALELLLAAQQGRFLAEASDELDEVAETLGTLDALRAVTVEEIAAAAGRPGEELTVGEILPLADERRRAALKDARDRLRALTEELEAQTGAVRDLTLRGIAGLRAALERLAAGPALRYGRDGLPPGTAGGPSFDERL